MSKNKYTRLLSNTMLFGISTFSSKILSFALTRLYTSVLVAASFGVVGLVTASANFLIPLVSLGISNAVIRFGLEKGVSKKGVFTGGLVAIFSGFTILILCWPLVNKVSVISGHVALMYVYVLVSCLRTLCCQFVRAKMYIRLYAIDGILSTAYTVGFNILYLVVLDMGATGYLLSIISADFLSIIGLFLVANLKKYISFKAFDKDLYKKMLRYSLPLVPAAMFWWVTTVSDKFFIAYIIDTAASGMYDAASKIPGIVAIFSTIFTEAWQLSAVTDGQGLGRERFFSQIFGALMGVIFLAGGGLIYACKLIMQVLVAPAYFLAWKYVPILIIATVFSCLVSFLNSVYMVEKKSSRSLVTMMVGAASNLIMNALLIPKFGPNGAAFATFLSYVIVFIIRAIDTRQMIHIDFAPLKMTVNTALLIGMAFLMIAEVKHWPIWCGILLAIILWINLSSLYRGGRQLLATRFKKKAPQGET